MNIYIIFYDIIYSFNNIIPYMEILISYFSQL